MRELSQQPTPHYNFVSCSFERERNLLSISIYLLQNTTRLQVVSQSVKQHQHTEGVAPLIGKSGIQVQGVPMMILEETQKSPVLVRELLSDRTPYHKTRNTSIN